MASTVNNKHSFNKLPLIILIICFLLASGLVAAPDSKVIVIQGARIVPVTSPEISKGTIIIKDGYIAEIGENLPIPGGADIIEASGLIAYPGLIDAYSSLGLVEISGVSATVDLRETGRINPQVRALEALRYDSMHIPIARSNGIVAALVAPQGGVISGQSCLIKLDGWTNREMAILHPAAMHIELPQIRTGRAFFTGRGQEQERQDTSKILEELASLFDNARLYEKRKSAHKKNFLLSTPDFDEISESLLPLLNKQIPAVISVHSDRDIKAVIDFVRKQNIQAILYDAEQGFKVAAEISKAGLPVIIGSLYDMPPDPEDGYDALFRNPDILSRAGVKIAFSSSSASLAKDLPYHAAKAAAFGLDKMEALKAVTIYPAEIFGLDKQMGSLEKGKLANVVLADNDILEQRTNIKYVFINGKQVDLSNRYTELLEKYSQRNR